jgi:hypothetical protein
MSIQITASTIDQFTKKLEAFSGSLSDAERTLFKGMLEGHGLSMDNLDKVTGGSAFTLSQHTAFSQIAPRLDAGYFTQLCAW